MIYVVGGGTFSYVRNHLALAAPAFGTTAWKLKDLLETHVQDTTLVLTRMADRHSKIETADDLRTQVIPLFDAPKVNAVFWNPAICDFDGKIGNIESGKHAQRIKTSAGWVTMYLDPAAKLINEIRARRPDIFLVSFKTTTGASDREMYEAGKTHIQQSGSNLVLVNDVVRRQNLVVTASGETTYKVQEDRDAALRTLVHAFLLERSVFEARKVKDSLPNPEFA